MMNDFFSRFESESVRKTLVYLGVAIFLIVIPLFIGFLKGNSLAVVTFFIGEIILLYAALRIWKNPIYYLVLAAISVILFLLLCFVLLDILVKMYQQGHEAEDIAWFIGGTCVAGFIAGIIGAIRFRKSD